MTSAAVPAGAEDPDLALTESMGEPPEHTLEPVRLIRRSGVVLRVGRVLLSAGCGSYRVRAAMSQVGTALGLDSVEAQVSVTEIVATSHQGPIFRTEVTQARTIGVNSERIALLEQFTRELTPGTEVEYIDSFLDEIERRPLRHGELTAGLFSGLACAAFAFLNNGGPIECAIVFVAAMLGQLVRRGLIHRGYNQFAVTLLAGTVAATAYLAVAGGLYELSLINSVHESGYVSAVLFLVPGFPLITGAMDLSRMDFTAGISRLAYAMMLLICAAVSVWIVSALFGLTPMPAQPPALDPATKLLLRLLASLLGVFGFAVLFNSPWRMAGIAALIGAIANVARLELLDAGMIAQGAAGVGGLIVGVLANIVAPRMRLPRLTLCVPAVVIMVPGASVYRAIYYLNAGDTIQALSYGVQAAFVVLALAIGLMMARIVTDSGWRRGADGVA